MQQARNIQCSIHAFNYVVLTKRTWCRFQTGIHCSTTASSVSNPFILMLVVRIHWIEVENFVFFDRKIDCFYWKCSVLWRNLWFLFKSERDFDYLKKRHWVKAVFRSEFSCWYAIFEWKLVKNNYFEVQRECFVPLKKIQEKYKSSLCKLSATQNEIQSSNISHLLFSHHSTEFGIMQTNKGKKVYQTMKLAHSISVLCEICFQRIKNILQKSATSWKIFYLLSKSNLSKFFQILCRKSYPKCCEERRT